MAVLHPRSSVGPTQDNRIKPDVVAPGVNIISSASSFSNDAAYGSTLVEKTTFNDREYPWICISGTSMATPCVAGIVALWLQADPTLTPERVKETLAATCTKPEEDLAYPNNTYGNGLIDAYAGMLHILNIPSTIKDISMYSVTHPSFRRSGKSFLHHCSHQAIHRPHLHRCRTVVGTTHYHPYHYNRLQHPSDRGPTGHLRRSGR